MDDIPRASCGAGRPAPTAAADRVLVDAVRRRREALKNLGGARRSR
jgi:hypothetical protein